MILRQSQPDSRSLTSIVVVGASLSGLRSAEVMREEGYDGHIVVVGAEEHLPYNRPALSKQFLSGEWDEGRVYLRPQEQLDALDLDFRAGVQAHGLDLERRSVTLNDGTTIDFDGLVIATGATDRTLPALEGRPRVFTLRTLDQARALRLAFKDATTLLIIGGGFIGAEVAATAQVLGIHVCIVEPQPTLMHRGLNREVGEALTTFHRQQGIDVRCNTSITQVTDDGQRTSIVLSDGTVHAPDVIVVGIGASPATDWLAKSSIACDNGVVCDEHLRATNVHGSLVPAVVAAGDVARWFSPSLGSLIRTEHWTNAQDQAANAARTLLLDLDGRGLEAPTYDPVPYVWSDQFRKKIQVIGFVEPMDIAHLAKGSFDDGKFLAIMERDGSFVGAVGMAMVPAVIQARTMLGEGASLDLALEKLSS